MYLYVYYLTRPSSSNYPHAAESQTAHGNSAAPMSFNTLQKNRLTKIVYFSKFYFITKSENPTLSDATVTLASRISTADIMALLVTGYYKVGRWHGLLLSWYFGHVSWKPVYVVFINPDLLQRNSHKEAHGHDSTRHCRSFHYTNSFFLLLLLQDYRPISLLSSRQCISHLHMCNSVLRSPLGLYRKNFSRVDEFTGPRFAGAGVLRTAGRMQILSMTQHAWRQITFGMKGNE
jgi:hypothetical protein